MKVFKNIVAFEELHTDALNIKHGCYWQSVMDEHNIRVLQNYRMAATLVVPVLTAVEHGDNNYQAGIRKIIDECEEVLKDESLYIVAGKGNPKLSRKLGKTIDKANIVVARAGNLCNELMCVPDDRVPKKIMALIERARDRCNRATRIVHYS